MSDMQLAISEEVVNRLFKDIRDKFAISHSDGGSFGPFTANYSAGLKLQHGKVDFQSNGTVLIKELDIVYDPLSITFGIDIPSVTVGGFCVIPTPFGCMLRAPKRTFFEGNPDISVTLDLGGVIATEVSASCSANIKHFNDSKGAGMSRWAALEAGHPNKWQVFLDPGYVDIDFIDIADSVGNLIDKLVNAVVDQIFGFLPEWAKKLIKAILGDFTSLIRKILDIGDDVQEWLSNLLGVSLGLFDFAAQMVLEYFAAKAPVFEFDDPYPSLPAQAGTPPLVPVLLPGTLKDVSFYLGTPSLVPVLVPIVNPSIVVDDKELVISASLGVL